MRKIEVKNNKLFVHNSRMTDNPLAYNANHAYKDEEGRYVLFTGIRREGEGTTWIVLHSEMQELSIMALQMIFTYHSEVVKPMQYRQQMLKIMSIEPEMSANRLAGIIHQPVSWIVAMLSISDEFNLLTMPLASAYVLSKWPKAPKDLVQKAQLMKSDEYVPLFYDRFREFKAAARKSKA